MSAEFEPQREFDSGMIPDLNLDSAREFDPEFDNKPRDRFSGKEHLGHSRTPSLRSKGLKWIVAGVGAILLVVGAMLATVGSPKPAGDETVFRNWTEHVQPINEYAQQHGGSVVRHLNRGGVASFVQDIQLGDTDRDSSSTQQVRNALSKRDDVAASVALVEAQSIPELSAADQQVIEQKLQAPVPKPQLTAGLKDAIVNGDAEMFHIYLFDSCDEDGDIVEVILDGQPFAIVPITHKGATLSVPIRPGAATNIALRGVRDGGGGITVACRTSQGDYFVKAMYEGEVQSVGVVK